MLMFLRLTSVAAALLALVTGHPRPAPAAQEHGPKGTGRFEHVHALAVDVEGRSLLLGAHTGLFRSEDGGRSWQKVTLAAKHAHLDVMAIAPDPKDPLTIYVGTHEAGVFKTADGGATWAEVNGGLAGLDVHGLAVDPTATGKLHAAVRENDLLFVADQPGAWLLYCAEAGHPGAGEQVLVVYEGHEGRTPAAPVEGVSGLHLWQYGLGRGRDVVPRAWGQERTFELILSGGMMGSDAWTINGKQYPRTDPLRVRKGDRVRVRLENHSMEAHPMHLHGQSFRVLAVGGARYREPIVKDSVDVDAHMGAVVLEFTAHNPGDWFFHCHKPMHMDGGMITLVKIG